MSDVTANLVTGNQVITNYDLSKIFVYNNRYTNGNLVNSQYSPLSLKAGTLMGRIAASNNLFPFTSGASNGSEYPIGILAADVDLLDGDQISVPICVAGDVVDGKVLFFHAPDALTTVVSGKTVYDRIGSDSVGIKLVGSNENTILYNQ